MIFTEIRQKIISGVEEAKKERARDVIRDNLIKPYGERLYATTTVLELEAECNQILETLDNSQELSGDNLKFIKDSLFGHLLRKLVRLQDGVAQQYVLEMSDQDDIGGLEALFQRVLKDLRSGELRDKNMYPIMNSFYAVYRKITNDPDYAMGDELTKEWEQIGEIEAESRENPANSIQYITW